MKDFCIKIPSDINEKQMDQILKQHHQDSKLNLKFKELDSQDMRQINIINDHLQSFQNLNDVSISIKSNCSTQQECFEKLLNACKNLSKLRKYSILVGDKCMLGQQGALNIAQSIQHLQSLQCLDIKIGMHNLFSSEGLVELSTSLQQLVKIKSLSLSINAFNGIDKESIHAMSQSFQKLQSLEKLDYQLIIKDIKQGGISSFSKGLSYLQNTLMSLKLEINCQNAGKSGLNELGQSIGNLIKLKYLSLSFTEVAQSYQSEQMEIANGIGNLLSLEELILKGFLKEAKEDVRRQFFNSLSVLSKLKLLEVDINFVDQEISFLSGLTNLKINLNQNIKLYANQLGLFEESLINLNKLEYLDLEFHFQNVDLLGVQNIGYALQNMNQLKSLKFKTFHNTIGYNGFIILAQGIKALPNLEILEVELNDGKVGQLGFQYLFSSIQQLKGLQQFYFASNEKICFNEVQTLAQSLYHLQNLTHLQISIVIERRENINIQCANQIAQTFSQLKNLRVLQFNMRAYLNCQEELENIIVKGLTNLKQLRELEMSISFLNSESAYTSFGKTLENLQFLEKLDLTKGNVVDQDKLIPVLQGVEKAKNLKNLQLVLGGINTTEMSEINFWSCFQQLKSLKYLNYSCKYQSNQYSTIENIFKGLQHLENLKYLYIYTNEEYSNESAVAFKECLQNLKKLEQLKLWISYDSSKFNQFGIDSICEGLLSQKKLQNLVLKYSGEYNYSRILAEAVQCIESLKECDLQISQQLQEEIQVNNNNNSMQQVEKYQKKYDNSKISSKVNIFQLNIVFPIKCLDIEQSFINLSQMVNITKLVLYCTEFQLSDQDIMNFSFALQYLVNLHVFTFSLSNSKFITCEGFKFLGKSLTYLKNLQKFYLVFDKDVIKNACQCNYLYEGISQLTNLQNLSLYLKGGNIIRQEGAVALGKSINHLKQLQVLEMEISRKNYFGEEGMVCIGQSLQFQVNIVYLDLLFEEGIGIGEKGAIALGNGISHMNQLQYLQLEIGYQNNINTVGGKAICKSFEKLLNLTSLNIIIKSGNNINSEVPKQFFKSLVVHENIKDISAFFQIASMESDFNKEISDFYQNKDMFVHSFALTPNLPQIILKNYNNKYYQGYLVSILLEDDIYFPKLLSTLEWYSHLPKIEKLSIEVYEYQLNEESCNSLLKALKTQKASFIKLYISGESKMREHLVEALEILKNNKNLNTLNLSLSYQDFISLDTYKRLSEIIGQMNNLTKLNYQIHCQHLVDLNFMKNILKNLISSKKLKHLTFPLIQNFEFDTSKLYQFAVKFNKRLVYLDTQLF